MIELAQNTLYTKLLDAVNMNASTSATQAIQGVGGYCIQGFWSGYSGSGETIATQGSNDGVNFTQVNSVNVTGATGSFILNVEKAHYRFVKVVYTTGTTTGTLTVTISGKVI